MRSGRRRRQARRLLHATDRRTCTSRTATEDEDRFFRNACRQMMCTCDCYVTVMCVFRKCFPVQDGSSGACYNGSARCRSIIAFQPNAVRRGNSREGFHGSVFNGTARAKCESIVGVIVFSRWPQAFDLVKYMDCIASRFHGLFVHIFSGSIGVDCDCWMVYSEIAG